MFVNLGEDGAGNTCTLDQGVVKYVAFFGAELPVDKSGKAVGLFFSIALMVGYLLVTIYDWYRYIARKSHRHHHHGVREAAVPVQEDTEAQADPPDCEGGKCEPSSSSAQAGSLGGLPS